VKNGSGSWKVKLGLAASLLVLAGFLIFQNRQVMTARFLFWEISASRSLMLLLAFILGVLTGLLVSFLARTHRNKP